MSILPEQQSSASNASYTKKKSAAKTKEKEPVRPHVKASLEDINWVRSQPPCVQQLWLDCVAVEQFGCQQREVKTSLSRNAFSKAKSALEGKGLFKFEQIYAPAKSGRGFVAGWKVENLHGYYKKNYWELNAHEMTADGHEMTTESQIMTTESHEMTAESHKKTPDGHFVCNTIPETCSTTDSEKNEPTLNQTLTTPLPPTKVVEGGSIIPQETETPLGGAPTSGGMLEKKEVSTISPALVKDPAEIASDEQTNLGRGECSAGGDIATELSSDVAYTEFPFQVGSQITINWPNTEHDGQIGIIKELYLKDQEVDVQLRGVLAIFCFPMARILGSGVAASTKARFNPEHAQNRKVRQSRLKCADMLGECPGAEFLIECWGDLLLRSQVKALIAKYPQWGIFVDSADQLQSWFD